MVRSEPFRQHWDKRIQIYILYYSNIGTSTNVWQPLSSLMVQFPHAAVPGAVA